MKWLKVIALVLLALVGVAAIVPFFVRLNDYIPALEKELTARVGLPVSIDSLHASLLPVPLARAEGITVGAADEIQVAKVTLKPDLWSLFHRQKVIRSVELDDVSLTQQALGALAGLAQGDRGGGSVRVDNVRLNNAVVKLEQAKFGPFDVHVEVANGAAQGLVTMKTRDGALEAKAVPKKDQFDVEIAARKWTPPMGPAFVFDELNVKTIVRAKDADVSSIQARLYGGTATGTMKLAWDKGVAISGRLGFAHVELQQPVALLSPHTRVSGKLDAQPAFSSRAATIDQLDDALRLESVFSVHDGVLHGFDIAAAAASLGKQTRGGQTRFDQLEGKLLLDQRTYRFSELKIASSGLVARGTVSISPSKALSGGIVANAAALSTLKVPLSIGGTLDSPMLLPNVSALAGAAAGTLILPGAGTAAGAKIGEVVEGLFSKKR